MLENYIKQQLKDLNMEDSPWTDSKVDELAQEYYQTHKLTTNDIKILNNLKLDLEDLDEPVYETEEETTKEDEMVCLTLTYAPKVKELRIFVNGILTGTKDYDMSEEESDQKWHMQTWDYAEELEEEEEYNDYLQGWYGYLLDLTENYLQEHGIERL